jgi:hypothetical protein
MNCKICDNETSVLFEQTVLRKYPVKYHHCKSCNFIQTDEPYWLDEAYSSYINLSDVGLVLRNLRSANIVASILYFFMARIRNT